MYDNGQGGGGRRDRAERRYMRPNDLNKPRNKEEAVAQVELCRTQIEGIERSLRSKTVDLFRSQPEFDSWRENAEYAKSQWEARLAIVAVAAAEIETRDAQVERLQIEIAQLRNALKSQQDKATQRRITQALERALTLAVLSGDAPADQKHRLVDALRVRVSPKFYDQWLVRARRNNWVRRGPVGRFEDSGENGGSST